MKMKKILGLCTKNICIGKNLYAWAIPQYMSCGTFKCVKPTLKGLKDFTDTSDIRQVYKVDVAYPKHLHDEHNEIIIFIVQMFSQS